MAITALQPLDLVAKAFLIFSQEYLMILVTAIGFWVYSRHIFGKALFILLFTIILNTYLKSIWPASLPTEGQTNYPFPSGPMQSAMVLWGWLAWEFHKPKFYQYLIVILVGTAFGLIHFDLNTLAEIFSAVLLGIITLILYHYFVKISWIKSHYALIGLIFLGLSMPILLLMPDYPVPILIADAILLLIAVGWICFDKVLPKQ